MNSEFLRSGSYGGLIFIEGFLLSLGVQNACLYEMGTALIRVLVQKTLKVT